MPTEGCFVCRCEEIDESTVRGAIEHGARTINDIKRRTRAGMGMCQGAYCAGNLARLLNEAEGTPFDQIAPMTARPPVRLISLGELSSLE